MAREQKMTAERLDILEYIGRQRHHVGWSCLLARGYHHMTVKSLVRWGYLSRPMHYDYQLTDKGKTALLSASRGSGEGG